MQKQSWKCFSRASCQVKAPLGEYEAIYVHCGDKIKTRKEGVNRTLFPDLCRDTIPEFILCRIKKWVPPYDLFLLLPMKVHRDIFTSLSQALSKWSGRE